MRSPIATLAALLATVALAAPAAADAASTNAPSRNAASLSMRASITSFHATASGVVANGTLTGELRSGTSVSRDSAHVRFAVAAARHGRKCEVVTLRLAPLNLELLGVQVTTSFISLDVYATHGRVLGDLFCALAHAKVTFPRVARVTRALNSHLDGRPLRVFAASSSLRAHAAETTCQVLKLVLGPLHLDLLGLVVDLYGQTKADPVIVTINAQPEKGLLGQLLCGLAGGTGVTSLGGLQSLLSSLGLSLSTTQIQNLLNQLGITNLTAGLTQLQLNQILQALGLGTKIPAG
jgi:hypothetical protein